MIRLCFWGLLLLLAASPIGSAAPLDPSVNPPFPLNLTFSNLKGAQIAIQESHEMPLVALHFWVRAGTAYEKPAQRGIAHLLEHVIFRGTAKRRAGSLDPCIEMLGGLLEATTERDWVHFHTTVPTPSWEEAFTLIMEHLFEAAIAPQELERERRLILNDEWASWESDPSRQLRNRLYTLAFGDQGYGTPVLGKQEDLRSLTREQIVAFYRETYVAANLVVVLVGDLSASRAQLLASQLLNRLLPSSSNSPPPTSFPPSSPFRPCRVEEAGTPAMLGVAFSAPAIQQREEVVAMTLLKTLLSNPMLILEPNGASADRDPIALPRLEFTLKPEYLPRRQDGLITLLAHGQSPEVMEQQLKSLVQALGKVPLPTRVVERLKQQVIAQFLFEQETFAGRAYHLGLYLTLGSPELAKNYLEEVQKVTPQRLQQVARTYLDWEKSVVLLQSPKRKARDSTPPTTRTTQQTTSTLQPSKSDLTVPHPSEISSSGCAYPTMSVPSLKSKVQRRVLENGLRSLVLWEPSAKRVCVQAFILAGVLEEAEFTPGLTTVLTRMLFTTTRNETRRTLASKLRDVGGQLHLFWEPNFTRVEITTTPERLDLALSLLSEGLLKATFEPEAFEQAKREALEALQTQILSPFQIGSDLVRKGLYSDHPYRLPFGGTVEGLKRLTLQEVLKFYRHFYTTNNLVLVIAGNVSPEQVLAKVRLLFEWSETPLGRRSPPPSIPARVLSGEKVQTVPVPTACLVAGYALPGVESRTYPALKVLSAILGEGKGARIFQKLREAKGLGYEWGINLLPLRGGMALIGSFQFKPRPVEAEPLAVRDWFKAVMESLSKMPPTESELVRAKHFLIGQYLVAHQRLSERAYWLGFWESVGGGYQLDLEMPHLLESVTADEVHQLAQRYLRNASLNLLLPQEEVGAATTIFSGLGHEAP